MISATSRYQTVGTSTWVGPDGQRLPVLAPPVPARPVGYDRAGEVCRHPGRPARQCDGPVPDRPAAVLARLRCEQCHGPERLDRGRADLDHPASDERLNLAVPDSGVRMQLYMGPTVPIPTPFAVSDATSSRGGHRQRSPARRVPAHIPRRQGYAPRLQPARERAVRPTGPRGDRRDRQRPARGPDRRRDHQSAAHAHQQARARRRCTSRVRTSA